MLNYVRAFVYHYSVHTPYGALKTLSTCSALVVNAGTNRVWKQKEDPGRVGLFSAVPA